jgi:cell division protein FtsB
MREMNAPPSMAKTDASSPNGPSSGGPSSNGPSSGSGVSSGSASGGGVPLYRRGFARRLGPKLLLLATLILIVDALIGDKGLVERLRERQRFNDVQTALETMRQENAALREQARRLREEDPATIESAARRQLGMIKPGEVLFIVKDVDAPPARTPSQSPAPTSSSAKP